VGERCSGRDAVCNELLAVAIECRDASDELVLIFDAFKVELVLVQSGKCGADAVRRHVSP
jgi:hypothetical protein